MYSNVLINYATIFLYFLAKYYNIIILEIGFKQGMKKVEHINSHLIFYQNDKKT